MTTKTFKVSLSLDNPRLIQSGINVRSFDKQSIKIAIELIKNSQVYQIPTGATIRISLLKLARQEQKIIVDVPNTNRDSIDWIVPDYLDGYQGTVRVGVYLVSGAENVDLGYFTILSNVSDIDKMADEFTDNVFQGWEQIEADLNELNLTIAQTKLDLAEDLTQIDTTIANINAKNTQVNTLASDFEADVATKQSDVTSKYNAFDTSVTTANQTIDDILGLTDDVQQVSAQVSEKVQNFKLKNEVANGDFSQGTTGWGAVSSINFSVTDGIAKFTPTEEYGRIERAGNIFVSLGKKYYLFADLKTTSPKYRISVTFLNFISGTIRNTQTSSIQRISGIQTANGTGWTKIAIMDYGASGFDEIEVYRSGVIDLTATFGAGNEPTKEEMDRLVEMVPNQWWDGELDLTQQQYVNWMLSFIREKANKTQEEWISPTLLNGWITGDSIFFAPLQYKKDNFGLVHIRGGISNGVNQSICTLPVGYRPKGNVPIIAKKQWSHTIVDWLGLTADGRLGISNTLMPTDTRIFFYAIFLAEN